jgi:hypothetical protein
MGVVASLCGETTNCTPDPRLPTDPAIAIRARRPRCKTIRLPEHQREVATANAPRPLPVCQLLIQGYRSIHKTDLTFAQAYLQYTNRYLFPLGDRHTRVRRQHCTALVRLLAVFLMLTCRFGAARFAQNATMIVTAVANITIWIATASSFQHASIPLDATPRSSSGSGRWRRRPHRDLPAVREQGHRIGSCRNTHDGSSQGMIGLESNAAVNGVPVWP